MCKNFRHFRDKKCVKMRHFLPVFSTFTVDLIDFFFEIQPHAHSHHFFKCNKSECGGGVVNASKYCRNLFQI